jgi:hypothetical protein
LSKAGGQCRVSRALPVSSTALHLTVRFPSHTYVLRHDSQSIHQALHSSRTSQSAGDARRAGGSGIGGSARLASAPRFCLSPHFSRSGIWTSAQRNPRFHAHRQSILLCAGESTSIGMSQTHRCDRCMPNTANTTRSLRILGKSRDQKNLR